MATLRKIALLAAVLMFLSPACARAQVLSAPLPNCPDDNGKDRCNPDVQRSVRERYGLETIEALAASGAEVRRAFFVDGYGNDMPAVAFERRPGSDPRLAVTVRVQHGHQEARVVVMTSPVSLQVWNDVIADTRHFDRQLVPLPDTSPELVTICLHGWVVTVEAAEGDGARRAVRRTTESACDDGLAVDAAFDMARRAYGLLAHCSALALAQYRNEVALLETCALLEGDRIAAGGAVNQFHELHRRYQAPASVDLIDLVLDDALLEWPGDAPARGRDAAARFWGRHMLDPYVRIHRVVGDNSRTVRITGRLTTSSGNEGRTTSAPFEQVWARENGFDFRLRELRVAAFELDPPEN